MGVEERARDDAPSDRPLECPCGPGKPLLACCMPTSETTLGDGQRVSFTYYLSVFASNRMKARHVGRFSERMVRTAGAAVLLSCFAGHDEVDEASRNAALVDVGRVCRDAVEAGRVTSELRALVAQRAFPVVLHLHRERRKIERELLAANRCPPGALDAYPRRKRLEIERRIVASALKSDSRPAHRLLRERYDALSGVIAMFPRSLDDLFVDELLRVKINGQSVAERLTTVVANLSVVADPAMEMAPEWTAFPLKWVRDELSLPHLRALIRTHAGGADLKRYFVERYADGAELRLKQYRALDAIPLLAVRREAIRQTFAAYDRQLYGPSLCASLAIVEGMVRDLCRAVEHKHGSRIDTGSGWTRIGQLLASAHVRAEVDEEFLRYFCGELYPARNPTLHGQRPELGSQEEAAAKLATVEYMIRRLDAFMTGAILPLFERLSSTTVDAFLDEFEAHRAEASEGEAHATI